MKTDYCFLLLLCGVSSLSACTKEQDSNARSPESPSTTPPSDQNTSSPNDDVDHGTDQRMGPGTPDDNSTPSSQPGPAAAPGGGPTSTGPR